MSTTILHIDSSILGDHSTSRQLSARLVNGLAASQGGARVVHRDLNGSRIPHFDDRTLSALGGNAAALADTLIGEIQQAEVVVIAAPMYNFGVPSQLKAWFDHIARAKVTFEYTPEGPRGLLTGKAVYVVHTRGGQYKGSAKDTVTGWLDTILGFVGMNEVTHVYAEGLNMGGDTRSRAIASAEQHIDSLIETAAAVEV